MQRSGFNSGLRTAFCKNRDPRRWGEGGGGLGTIPNATLPPPEWLLHSNGQDCELLHI